MSKSLNEKILEAREKITKIQSQIETDKTVIDKAKSRIKTYNTTIKQLKNEIAKLEREKMIEFLNASNITTLEELNILLKDEKPTP